MLVKAATGVISWIEMGYIMPLWVARLNYLQLMLLERSMNYCAMSNDARSNIILRIVVTSYEKCAGVNFNFWTNDITDDKISLYFWGTIFKSYHWLLIVHMHIGSYILCIYNAMGFKRVTALHVFEKVLFDCCFQSIRRNLKTDIHLQYNVTLTKTERQGQRDYLSVAVNGLYTMGTHLKDLSISQ